MIPAKKLPLLLLAMVLLVNLGYFFEVGLPYLLWKPHKMRAFSGREGWIITHVAMGGIALLSGPVQFWLAWKNRFLSHKRLGQIYTIAIGISGMASFYLAWTNQISWVYGLGLGMLGIVWWGSTGMGIVAIRRHKTSLHQDWMTRSYLLTLGFVFFRMFISITTYWEIGSPSTRMEVASWLCWVIPLLMGEILIHRTRTRRSQVAIN